MAQSDDELNFCLDEMIAHVVTQPEIFRPSRFWSYFERKNLDQLSGRGLTNFKRTINQNYYNWILSGVDDNQFRAVAKLWGDQPSLEAFGVVISDVEDLEGFFEANPLVSAEGRDLYRLFLGMLWQYTKRSTPNGLTDALVEPLLGNPIRCSLDGRLISQDLANSIRERNALLAPLEHKLSAAAPIAIVELGAGYGRLGYVLLSSAPCRYTIVDIPPALHVSQWYLTSLFPSKRIFNFKPWTDLKSVEAELRAAELSFLTPDQFAKLPDKFFDAGAAISNLGEMTKAQSDLYVGLLARLVSEIVYIKQWKSTRNGFDDVRFEKADFDLPAPWQPVLDRTDAVQDLFFETVWQRALG